MMVFMISAGLGVLVLLFRLAAVFRLTIPLLYVVVMNTVCHSWYQAHSLWGDRLFFILLGLVALSWLISLGKRIGSFLQERRDDRAAVEQFTYRVRKARERGEDTVSTENLWR